jgi:hypothetical protein
MKAAILLVVLQLAIGAKLREFVVLCSHIKFPSPSKENIKLAVPSPGKIKQNIFRKFEIYTGYLLCDKIGSSCNTYRLYEKYISFV